ncbi:Ig-like domain-containing protein [Lelliottia sp. SL45]|uniref:Ig-like domain-containing protein n=1 Tax=Lelliottia sp. SL45 TaxID=2994665 RepID=UPI002272C1C2|nr:Ig-like domain-containing protein [Lelliottia sp. SL45]MCY1697151.1 Ig-like domain-containing protein [Lelliottia sp. SL45]
MKITSAPSPALKTTLKPVARYFRLRGSTTSFLHGVETTEVTTGAGTVIEVASCVIGIVGTAELATPGELALVRNIDDVKSSIGPGSIYNALRRIYDNYVSSQTIICLPLGKDDDFTQASLAPSGVSTSSASITLFNDSALTSPGWIITNPHCLPLTFTSGDEGVMMVGADGTPVPVAEGDTTLTVTVGGGDAYTSDVITISVTVAADEDIPAGLVPSEATFSKGATTLYVAQPGMPVALTNPANQSVRWSGSDDAVAQVEPLTGMVTPQAAGTMTLTATLGATDTVMAGTLTCTVTVEAAPANPLLASFIGSLSLFRASRQKFGFTPKVMIAPGILDMEGALGPANSLGNQLRAVWFADVPAGFSRPEEAYAWKQSNAVYPRIAINWPRVAVLDKDGSTVWDWMAPAMAGLCCQLDKGLASAEFETGYWCSPSNYVLPDVLGVEYLLEYIPNDPDCEVNYLNSQGISTVINQLGGWRAFGNRLTAWPQTSSPTTFINWRRVTDIIEDSIEWFTVQYLDRPMFTRPTDLSSSLLGIIMDGVNGFLRSKIGTALVYGRCYIDPAENTLETLQQGIIRYRYQITPPVPIEHVQYTSEIYIGGLEQAFRKLIGG